MALVTALMLFKCKCRIQLFFSKRDLVLFLVQRAQLSALFSSPGSCRSWGCQHPETRVCGEEKVGEKCGTAWAGLTVLFLALRLSQPWCAITRIFFSIIVTSGQAGIQLWTLQKNPREFPEMLVKVLHVSVSGAKYSTCQTHLFSLLIINMGWKNRLWLLPYFSW